jgi:hypothetical protein
MLADGQRQHADAKSNFRSAKESLYTGRITPVNFSLSRYPSEPH